MATESIEFSCSSCGSKDFEFPTNPQPDDLVTCNGCGGQEKYGVLIETAINQTEGFISKMVENVFE